jgi:hypothetical protein
MTELLAIQILLLLLTAFAVFSMAVTIFEVVRRLWRKSRETRAPPP